MTCYVICVFFHILSRIIDLINVINNAASNIAQLTLDPSTMTFCRQFLPRRITTISRGPDSPGQGAASPPRFFHRTCFISKDVNVSLYLMSYDLVLPCDEIKRVIYVLTLKMF